MRNEIVRTAERRSDDLIFFQRLTCHSDYGGNYYYLFICIVVVVVVTSLSM